MVDWFNTRRLLEPIGYVTLTEALGCPLVTLDRKLSRAPGPTCDIIVPSRQMTGES